MTRSDRSLYFTPIFVEGVCQHFYFIMVIRNVTVFLLRAFTIDTMCNIIDTEVVPTGPSFLDNLSEFVQLRLRGFSIPCFTSCRLSVEFTFRRLSVWSSKTVV